MRIVIKNFTQEEWCRVIQGFDDLSLMQTWEFAEAKRKFGRWGVARCVFREEGQEIIGATQALIKPFPVLGRGLVWINQGPLWRRAGEQVDLYRLREILQELRRYWAKEKGMYFRIAPLLIEQGQNGNLIGDSGLKRCVPSRGWASAVIDLTRSLEDLRKALRQKWRNCLNKSERMDLACEAGARESLLKEFLNDYKRLFEHKRLQTGITPDFIRLMQGLLPEKRKMWVFVARKENRNLGGILIVKYGTTCMYLAGAVNHEGRKLNANYFLLWQALYRMKELGIKVFDLGGMDEYSTPSGIFHFKQGLSGTAYRLVGEFESYRQNILNSLIKWRVQRVRER